MNDIQLRWKERVMELPAKPGRFDRIKILQYRKYYDRTFRAYVSLPEHSRFEDWGWSEWMDVPDE